MTTTEWSSTSRVGRRFWGYVGNQLTRYGILETMSGYRPGATADETARLSEYAICWAYYENRQLYRRLRSLGVDVPAGLPVEWNPVPAVIAFYVSATLSGALTIQADDPDYTEALSAAVRQIWEWSNFETMKAALTRTAAVMGDVFVKVAERRETVDWGDAGTTTAVYLQDIPPETVRWWEADERDFLTGIRIDTPRLTSIFTGEERRHTLVEVWNKTWPDGGPGGVRFYEVRSGQMLDDTQLTDAAAVVTFDDLGYDFIPVVWSRSETHWRHQTDGIDRYNTLGWQASRLNRPLGVVNSNTVDNMGRPQPAPDLDLPNLATSYAEAGDGAVGLLSMPGMSAFGWAAAPVDFAAMNVRLGELREGVIDGLPEYRVATLRGIQIAAETLQLLMNQAEQRVLEMRSGLERALSRAQMMAITVAQLAELEPALFAREQVGSYEEGTTEHVFTERPVFEKTAAARAAEAALHIENGVSINSSYLLAGYSEEDAKLAMQIDTAEGLTQ